MTVKELVEKLKQYPEDHKILLYVAVGEDADWAHGVMTGDPDDEYEIGDDQDPYSGRPYVKGDWPDVIECRKGAIRGNRNPNTVIIK